MIPSKRSAITFLLVFVVLTVAAVPADAQFIRFFKAVGRGDLKGAAEAAVDIAVAPVAKPIRLVEAVLEGDEEEIKEVFVENLVSETTGVSVEDIESEEVSDLLTELVTGEDPGDIELEIQRLVERCRAGAEELGDPARYLRAERNFDKNGGHFRDFRYATGQYVGEALLANEPLALAIVAGLEYAYYRVDDRMNELKQLYEDAVRVCEQELEKAAIIRLTRLLEIVRLVLSSAEERMRLVAQILDAAAKQRLEYYLHRRISDDELSSLANTYPHLVADLAQIGDALYRSYSETSQCYTRIARDIERNPGEMLYRFNGYNALELCYREELQ